MGKIFTIEQPNSQNAHQTRLSYHRYCYFDWHYKLGVTKTLEPYEIETVLSGKSIKPSMVISW